MRSTANRRLLNLLIAITVPVRCSQKAVESLALVKIKKKYVHRLEGERKAQKKNVNESYRLKITQTGNEIAKPEICSVFS